MNNKLTDYFDAIYCINLEKRKDRWIAAKEEFKKIGIDNKVVRFSAFESQIKHVWCAISHYQIIQIAQQSWYNNVLVLEDDIIFNLEKIKYLEKAIKQLQLEEWDIFYLWISLCLNDIPFAFKKNDLLKIVWGRSTHAIAYNRSMYNVLLRDLPKDEKSGILFTKDYMAIDAYLSRFIQRKINAFIPLENICIQRISFSDNENKIHNLGRHQGIYFFLLKQKITIQKIKKILNNILYIFLWK